MPIFSKQGGDEWESPPVIFAKLVGAPGDWGSKILEALERNGTKASTRVQQLGGGEIFKAGHQSAEEEVLKESSGVAVCVYLLGGWGAVEGADLTYAVFRSGMPTLALCPSEEVVKAATNLIQEQGEDTRRRLFTACVKSGEDGGLGQAVEFLWAPPMPGRVFVLDGGDGAGKETQTRKMKERMESEGYPHAALDFPNDKSECGALIRALLDKSNGHINKGIHPFLRSALYASNRWDCCSLLSWWVVKGYNVLLDRYCTSNFGYQASKEEDPDERRRVVANYSDFEYGALGLPRPARVVYLDLPPEVAMEAMSKRKNLDENELASVSAKNKIRGTFKWMCEESGDWICQPCLREGETGVAGRLTIDEVHDSLFTALKPQLRPPQKPAK